MIHSYLYTNCDYHFNWCTRSTQPSVSRAKLKVSRKSIISILFGRHLLKWYFVIRLSLKHTIVLRHLIQFCLTISVKNLLLMVKNSSSIFSLNITVELFFCPFPLSLSSHTFQQSIHIGYKVLYFGFPLLKQEFIGSIIALVSLTLHK